MPFRIAKLYQSLEEVATGNKFNTEVCELEKPDLKLVTKKKGWQFNWRQEFSAEERKCYKLKIEGSEEIQGLLSFEDEQTHLLLHLLETAPVNFGKGKKYRGVLQSLTAFACKQSMDYGYEGAVTFRAKTKLIAHYEKQLGAIHIGGYRMAIYEEEAQNLVSLYFKDFIG